MNSTVSHGQHVAVREGVKLWRHGANGVEAVAADFAHPKEVVLLIHGFTATAEDMSSLAEFLQQEGAGCTVINCTYPCFIGIDRAAAMIAARLIQFADVIEGNRVAVVAHSMGGLVARSLIALSGGDKYVRGAITLGTPHLGTLKDANALSLFLGLMEKVKKSPLPGPYFTESRSGKQLICADNENLIEKLRCAPCSPNVRWVSFSGGKRGIEFGSNWLKNALANWYIQGHFGTADNDGLVGEVSSCTENPSLKGCLPDAIHLGKNSKEFSDFDLINHSALVNHGWTQVEVLKRLKSFFS